jgi:hypothetical protein
LIQNSQREGALKLLENIDLNLGYVFEAYLQEAPLKNPEKELLCANYINKKTLLSRN